MWNRLLSHTYPRTRHGSLTPGMAHPPQEWLTFQLSVWLSVGANGNIPD